MSLHFYYFPSHNFVTVRTVASATASKEEQEMCSAPGLLANMLPDDEGVELPVASGVRSAGAGPDSPSELGIDRAKFGSPFRWAQSLCGMHHVHPRIPAYPQPSLNLVLERLVTRYTNQLSLHKQYALFVKKQYPFSSTDPELFPTKSKAYLNSWKPIKMDKWPGTADKGAAYFEAVFNRSQVELQALIEVSADYPQRVPVFKLSFLKDMPGPTVNNDLVEQTADPEVLQEVLVARAAQNGKHKNDAQ
eukprot:g55162.t1